ncbi:MAG: hypothetical protein K1X64_04215 [Myxococcaceae bacterium]|nr:hypothetical protein [Myxococcaceae bacterium]
MNLSTLLVVGANLLLSAPFPTEVKTAASLEGFAPALWRIEQTLNKDLDGDAIDDAAVVLIEAAAPHNRALLVLLKRQNTWALVASSRDLLQCGDCAGAKGGDGAPTMALDERVLTITQTFGSRPYGSSTHRFRLDKSRHRLELIGLDTTSGDSLVGTSSKISTNLLTGVTRSQIVSCAAPCDEAKPQLEMKRSTTRKKVAPLLTLEQVKGN